MKTIQTGIIVVDHGDDLNMILNNTKEGDTILVKRGKYTNISLSDRIYSEKNPLVLRASDSDTQHGTVQFQMGRGHLYGNIKANTAFKQAFTRPEIAISKPAFFLQTQDVFRPPSLQFFLPSGHMNNCSFLLPAQSWYQC
jgi:hypothetical protein